MLGGADCLPGPRCGHLHCVGTAGSLRAASQVGGYVALMFRQRLCARPGCGAPASVVLTFQYATRTVWLLDQGELDPAAIDLCTPHADRLSPPRGWTGHDRRASASPGMSTSVAS